LAVAALILVLSSQFLTRALWAENQRPILIIKPIDESKLVTLAGNTRFEATARNDRGPVPDSFPLDHMLLQLRRAPALERQFDQHVDSLTDKSSPNFRQWMTAAEQGEKYGLAQQDINIITGWLASQGFKVGYVYPSLMVIDFSGTAGQIREAFHTEIHYLEVNGEQHFANMSDPKIPEALAPAVLGVVSLHNFKPHPMYTFAGCGSGNNCYALVPADFQTIYNVSPLYKVRDGGITGQHQTVVVVEDSDAYSNDWSTYVNTFALAGYGGSFTTVHPDDAGNCTDPLTNGDDIEADLDVEMVTAFAPGATVELASCTTTATFGGLIAIENLVSAGNPPAIISMSYGECEVLSGPTANAAFNSAFQTAAAAGVSVFASSGDYGASDCARDFPNGIWQYYALPGIGVTGWGETIYNVSVGGTDFEDTYNALEGGLPQSHYWNSTNNPTTYGSAKSYIPEIPWNDSCASYLQYYVHGFATPYGASGFCNSTLANPYYLSTSAGGGGPSGCAYGAGNLSYLYTEDSTCAGYAKPSWQYGIFGNPADGVRDIPDVSLFASNNGNYGNVWGHYIIICYSDLGNGGLPCTAGAPDTWSGVGGTSASAPAMAAIQALVNEKWEIRAGNPNPTYYAIAKAEFGSSGNSTCYSINQPGNSACAFYDITQGDNDIDCAYNGTFEADCYSPSSSFGTLGTQAISSLTREGGGIYMFGPVCSIDEPANLSPYLSPTGGTIYAGGTRATCQAIVTPLGNGYYTVTSVLLTNAGNGYTGVPACHIYGGGGGGAFCTAVITPTTGAAAYQPAFGATPGWDMATGIGSVNAYNLVYNGAWLGYAVYVPSNPIY
jgi:subtilase family serine protease